MKCPTCGDVAESGSALCMNCGAALPTPQSISEIPAEPYANKTSGFEPGLPRYIKVGIIAAVILIIIIAFVIYVAINTLDIKANITYEEFADKYVSGIPEDKIGEKENIEDRVTQKHYNETMDMIGVNFESTGRVTDITSGNQTFDLMVPKKFNDRFYEGDEVQCTIKLTKNGPEVTWILAVIPTPDVTFFSERSEGMT